MKKQNNTRPRLVLKKHIIRVLDTKELVVAAGGSGNDTQSLSGCPACGNP
jgi:hypothetical protein